jgi:hypothetical protein
MASQSAALKFARYFPAKQIKKRRDPLRLSKKLLIFRNLSVEFSLNICQHKVGGVSPKRRVGESRLAPILRRVTGFQSVQRHEAP